MKTERSQQLYAQSTKMIPGGVNSPVRACKSVGSEPLFIDRAEGCLVYDADGNTYIDYVGSWGPMILGHRHPKVIDAIKETLDRGTSFGAPTNLETTLALMIIDAIPSIDMVRMVNSGTEATMSAIRLARGVTQRDTIIKFDGCYHGHADTLLVEAGSGVATLGIPGSPGVPESVVQHTLSLPYNDMDAIKHIMDKQGKDIACIIVEPIAGNMGLVAPINGFLETLRELTQAYDALLIFDEVMTGFRVAYGGAQALYGILPDITCLGKIIGGGMPVGAYGGRHDIMSHIAPQGPVYQAGTLSGNPVAMAAGIAALSILNASGFYEHLDNKSDHLISGLKKASADNNVDVYLNRVGSMMGMFFTKDNVLNFNDAKKSDLKKFSAYYQGMRDEGIYLAPSQFEAFFMSSAHETDHIETTIKAAEKVFQQLK